MSITSLTMSGFNVLCRFVLAELLNGTKLPPGIPKKRIPSIIAVVLTVAFFILGFKNRDLIDPGLLTRLDFLVMDQKFKLRGFQPPGNEVVMVAFDDRTLDRYGTFRLFERDKIASLIDHLSAAKPKVIGLRYHLSRCLHP